MITVVNNCRYSQGFKNVSFSILSVSQWVQLLSFVWLFATPWTAAHQASLSPRVCSNSYLLNWWCYPTISSSVVLFFSHIQFFPASGSLPVSQFFTSGGQSIEVSASASVLPLNIQDWFPPGWTGWISAVQRTLKSLLQHHSSKASILLHSAFFLGQLSHPYMTTGETIALTRWTFAGKIMSLLFNMLSRLVITFLPRSKRLLISWLQSSYAVILEPPKIICHCFHCFPIYLPWRDGTGCHDVSFLNTEF